MSSNKKVAVAMSGGVDSSVAAILLKKQGYEVVGVTGVMQKEQDVSVMAKAVCDSLGIEHHCVDMTQEFDRDVIKYFEDTYKKGETPNPCVLCNKKIKWGRLFDYSQKELGSDFYATGHYAKIAHEDSGYCIYRAKDEKKDQLYMLFELSQSCLSKTLFPLGDLSKDEVRKIAAENNLPSKASKESQDICFIPSPDTTKKYLSRTFKEQKGDFVDVHSAKVLGHHTGFYQFTIGQRKGIGIAAAEPLYVVELDAKTNTVYVGSKEDLFQNKLELRDVNWQQHHLAKGEFDAMVKIRYNTSAKPAKVIPAEYNTASVIFDENVSSITPGQAAVIYDSSNTFLIGGGWIVDSRSFES